MKFAQFSYNKSFFQKMIFFRTHNLSQTIVNYAFCIAHAQFPALRHLRSVDLSSNRLTSIDRSAFLRLGNSVETVALDNNLLKTIREEVRDKKANSHRKIFLFAEIADLFKNAFKRTQG